MPRVLIAEPSPPVRELLATIVRMRGYEAVELLPGEAPPADVDLVLLEPLWPEGRRAVEALGACGEDVPVVCVSVCERSRATEVACTAGYLVKPFGVRELERAITRVLATTVTLAADYG